jgi:hypothetical protein
MKGDFSRVTFDPTRHFSRVLQQQGRVQLDADGNEQTAILLHYLRTLAADLIGPYGGPDGTDARGLQPFEIKPAVRVDKATDLEIGSGRYYAGGLLCENEPRFDAQGQPAPALYFEQADYPRDRDHEPLPGPPFLVYLDVWERHLTWVEDDAIREPALEGPDTSTRAQVVWQVKVATDELAVGLTGGPKGNVETQWPKWVATQQPPHRGLLQAQAKLPEGGDDTPCTAAPEASYRGPENQLYRVEIHDGGAAAGTNALGNKAGGGAAGATFKWSRDNGTCVFPITRLELDEGVTSVFLEQLGRDERCGLSPGDWVEIADDGSALRERAGALLEVDTIDVDEDGTARVTLKGTPTFEAGDNPALHPLLRRWDHHPAPKGASSGTVAITEDVWIALEDGVQVLFQSAAAGSVQQYRGGDYWLIPARTVTGDVVWPRDGANPRALPPRGVEHCYAPLAVIGAGPAVKEQLRVRFAHLPPL